MNTNEIWQLVEQQFNVFKRKGAGKRPKDWFNKHFFFNIFTIKYL